MLIESDFVKYGFKKQEHARQAKTVLYVNSRIFDCVNSKGDIDDAYHIQVDRLRKGMQRLTLYTGRRIIESEFMSSPEELRLFMIKHNLIVEKIKS